MKRLVQLTLAATTAVLLAACGTGSPSGDSSTPSSTGSSMVASTTAASSVTSSTPAPSTGPQSSTGALDAASVTWFDALCTDLLGPFHEIDKADAAMGSMGAGPNNPAQAQANAAAGLAALTKTSAALAGAPPPGFDGGEAYAAAVTDRLTAAVSGLSEAQQSAATDSTHVTDPAVVEENMNKAAQQTLMLIMPLYTAIGQLDPAVQALANDIPSCKAAGGIDLAQAPVVPADLDQASITWFDTLCTSLMNPLGDIASAEKSAAAATGSQTPPTSTAGARLQVLTRSAQTLASTPPPGFQGGEVYASKVVAELQGMVQANGMSSMEPLMSAIGRLEPTVWAAANELPSCQGQLPGGS